MSAFLTKGRTVLLLLVLAAALWFASTQQWADPAAGAGAGVPGVAQSEEAAAADSPVLAAAAGVLAVSALLLAMLGRVGRYIVLGLVSLVGAGACAAALSALGTAPAASVWPAAAAGALTLATALCAVAASGQWKVSARYERSADSAADEPEEDPASAWDALSRGEDPS